MLKDNKGIYTFTIFPGNGNRMRLSVTEEIFNDKKALEAWIKSDDIFKYLLPGGAVRIIVTERYITSIHDQHLKVLKELKSIAERVLK